MGEHIPGPDIPAMARSAYGSYGDRVGWVSQATGSPMPEWDELTETTRNAWETAVADVLRNVGLLWS